MTRLESVKRKTLNRIRLTASLAALTVPTVLVGGCSDEKTYHTRAEAKKIAYDQYFNRIENMAPEERFIQQFLRPMKVDVNKESDVASFKVFRVKIGNACLSGTPYDISGNYKNGKIDPNIPLGSTPTAVKVTGDEPELFQIQPVDPGLGALIFKGAGGDTELSPADQFTGEVLSDYNCRQNIVEMPVVEVATN